MDTAHDSVFKKTNATHDVAKRWRGRACRDGAALTDVSTECPCESDGQLAQLAVVPASGNKASGFYTLYKMRIMKTVCFDLKTLFSDDCEKTFCSWCSEFLAEENPLYFWQFLDEIGARTSYVTFMSEDVDELGVLAMAVAETIAPGSKSVG